MLIGVDLIRYHEWRRVRQIHWESMVWLLPHHHSDVVSYIVHRGGIARMRCTAETLTTIAAMAVVLEGVAITHRHYLETVRKAVERQVGNQSVRSTGVQTDKAITTICR